MAFNLNDFTQYFDNPAVSLFDRSQNKSFPMRIGKFYPAKWDLLSFGNSAKGRSAHGMRVAPLVVPTLTNMRLQEHTGVIPLRSIIQDFEEKFNYATNKDGASLPHFTYEQLHTIYDYMLANGLPLVGSLFDFLGFPVYGDVYKSYLNSLNKMLFNYSDGSSVSPFSDLTVGEINDIINTSDGVGSIAWDIHYRGSYYTSSFVFMHFIWYLSSSSGYYNFLDFIRAAYPDFDYLLDSDLISIEKLIPFSIYDTVISALNAYRNVIFSQVLNKLLSLQVIPVQDNRTYTTLPLRAYWRFHYDWNTNGNFIDRDTMLEEYVFNFEDTILSLAPTSLDNPSNFDRFVRLIYPVNRLWDNDYFTSLLPTAAVDNAVEIPANSTVLDLAKLTAWQKFVMKLSYSSRYRDVIWNIFKIKPSDAHLMQSYPIRQKSHNIAIGEVLQSSQSTTQSVLGDFAGRAYSSGKNKGYHIFCEEPCVVIDFVSIVPAAVYADALHPLIHVDDILDFPIPEMDVLGNQPISSEMVSGNPTDSDLVLGYGRQYQEWFGNYNTVHGEFKTDLDYWVLTRRFNDVAPVINDDFLRMHDADDFDKIFSVSGTPHAFLDIYFSAFVTRHAHRNVRILI